MITAQRVKEALVPGKVFLQQICYRLDLPEADSKGRGQVRKILRDLVKFKQVTTEIVLGHTLYTLCDKPRARGEVQELLWRAMCLKNQKAQPFSVADAARLAEADRDYAKRYCRFCAQQGSIHPVGRRGNARIYLVTPGKEREPAPRWNRRAEKRERTAGKNAGATEAGKPGPLEILADMEAVLIAISGEALILKGFLLEMRAAVGAAAGGGHGAESGDQQ